MKTIYTFLFSCIVSFSFAQINKAEYFIDTDPGIGGGIPISITNGFSVTKSFSIDTTPLSLGVHTLYVRTRDINKVWSIYFKQNFLVHTFASPTPVTISKAEYFIDTDPGIGSGIPIPITAGFSVSKSFSIDTTPLNDGIHTLYVRTRDADKTWSLYFKQNFLVHTFTSPTPIAINKAEFFFDTDPGVGLGVDIPITSGFSINKSVGIPSGGLTEGTHYLFIRTRDGSGVWSLYENKIFVVTPGLGVVDNLLLLTRIYPVPASSEITIDANIDIESITLFDLNGKEIKRFNIDKFSNKIDVSHYEKGVYFLQIKDEKGVLNKKIIIE